MSPIVLWAALGSTSLSAAGGSSERIQPSDKWVINFADNRCEATRPFGSKDDPIYFLIKPSPTSGVVQIALIRSGNNFKAVQDEVALTFDNGKSIKASQLHYGIPKQDGRASKQDVRLINLNPEVAAKLDSASELKWSGPSSDYQLALGKMSPVMKILADCRADLRKYWNIEPALQSALREPPATLKPILNAFSTNDYPAEAVRNDESGTTAVVMLVDEKGQLADCMLDETSGVPTLDAMTCIIIKQRVKFRPAVGPDGKAARAVLTTRIRWVVQP